MVNLVFGCRDNISIITLSKTHPFSITNCFTIRIHSKIQFLLYLPYLLVHYFSPRLTSRLRAGNNWYSCGICRIWKWLFYGTYISWEKDSGRFIANISSPDHILILILSSWLVLSPLLRNSDRRITHFCQVIDLVSKRVIYYFLFAGNTKPKT